MKHAAPRESGCTIALVRHARSAHIQSDWITAAGFRAWLEEYESAGIAADQFVPGDVAELAQRAGAVVSSNAPRALATARLLAPDREIVVSPLVAELPLDAPKLGRLRLPLSAWAFPVGMRTAVLTLRGQYPAPAELARVSAAAEWLGTLASEHSLVVVVTHAWFRQQLAARLRRDGWEGEHSRFSVRHWSTWLLRQTRHR